MRFQAHFWTLRSLQVYAGDQSDKRFTQEVTPAKKWRYINEETYETLQLQWQP